MRNVFGLGARLVLVLSLVGFGLAGPSPAVPPAAANGPFALEAPTWLTNPSGHVIFESGAGDFGSLKGTALNAPIVTMAPTKDRQGYWLAASDGGVFSFGSAGFFGSLGSLRLNAPIISMTPTNDNKGYWLLASDGGIFCFGNAAFYGSTGSLRLNQPIVALAPTPTGKGYWLVASDGGVFSFGDAAFYGSTGSLRLVRPIVSLASTPSGKGYWMMAADGGVFTFGDAAFYGSAGGAPLMNFNRILSAPDGKGYWLVRNGGDTLAFGSAATLTPAARPAIAQTYAVQDAGDAAVDYALRRMDTPYLWGGNGPNYDCSGLTQQAWKAQGVSIPRVAADQYKAGRKVGLNELRPGDLLFWGSRDQDPNGIDHVGMYVGGGWAVNSGGQSTPSRISMRSVPNTAGWMMPLAVRPNG